MGGQVTIGPSARSELAEIVRYVAAHNSDAAARLGFDLITRAEGLASFPEMGRMVPEFRQRDLCEIICRSYRIIYRLQRECERIEIVRFWHGARGFPHIPGEFRASLGARNPSWRWPSSRTVAGRPLCFFRP